MARKLKTYTTSAGFFDLAVAAPSMKAALEAWGARHNLFHQGFARETADPRIVAATMARPGVVLRRAVGSSNAFGEHAELPRALPAGKTSRPPRPPKATERKVSKKAVDSRAAANAPRIAALAFEKEQKRQDSERRREEARLEKEHQRRERAIAAVQARVEEATREHERRTADVDKQRAALDRKAQAEQARWEEEKAELEAALRKARTVSYLRPVR